MAFNKNSVDRILYGFTRNAEDRGNQIGKSLLSSPTKIDDFLLARRPIRGNFIAKSPGQSAHPHQVIVSLVSPLASILVAGRVSAGGCVIAR
jgi:hypothetical protein